MFASLASQVVVKTMPQSPVRREESRDEMRTERRDERREEQSFEDRAPRSEDLSSKLFIANLTYNTRDRDLEDIFEKYGRVLECRVAEDRETGRSKGFAFITMEDSKAAADAVAGVNGMDLDGRTLKVELSNGGSGRRGGGGGDRFGGGGFRGDDRRGGGGRSDICYDWQSGRCSRGSSCRFSHDGAEGSSGGNGGGRGEYRDDYRGGGDRGRDSRDSYRDSGRDYGRDGGRDRGYDRRDSRDVRDRSRDRY